MIQPTLVIFDDSGNEAERRLTGNEIALVHFHQDGSRAVLDVELRPGASTHGVAPVRVNLNDGVSLTFDSPEACRDLLTEIRDAINAAEARLRRTHLVLLQGAHHAG